MSYIESTDSAEMDRIEQALGRRYAQHVGLPYPVPPVVVGPGKQPPDLARYHQRWYRRFLRHRSGGVLELDDNAVAWEGSSVRLDDGTQYTIRTQTRALTREQLSQDSRDTLDLAETDGGRATPAR